MKLYLKGGFIMNKLLLGVFALMIILGNQFGSMFGIAVAICIFMIADGLLDEFKRRRSKKIITKKE
jgi:hypothetical protein